MRSSKHRRAVSSHSKNSPNTRSAKTTRNHARAIEQLENRLYLSSGTGLRADYYNAPSTVFSASTLAVTSTPVLTRTDSTVDFDWGFASPDPGVVSSQAFAARWSGQILSEQAGTYVFHVTTGGAVNLWINGQQVINDYTPHSTTDDASIAITLQANTLYNIRLDFAQTASTADDSVMLEWVLPDGTRQVIPTSQLYPYSGPLTITSGGTYVGSWQSTDYSQNAITIDTAQPVTIDDSNIQGAGTLIATATPGVQLTVQNSTATGLNPNVAGVAPGEFLEADNAASLDIENNAISNVGGYALDVDGFTGTDGQTINILNNSFSNINGAYSDGNGGYESTGQATPHAIILDNVIGVAGINIAWNQIINTPGQSYVNDVINIYDSSGTADSPININNNFIQGLYAIDPATQQDSGCGIITDGEITNETAYVNIYDNTLVSTGNAGIGIAAGHDISVYGNTIVSSGYLPDGTAIYSQNVGLYIWDQMTGGSSATFYNNGAYDNTVGWVQAPNTLDNTTAAAVMNNWWFPDATAALTYGNTNWTGGQPTTATETAQYTAWQSELAANVFTVGPVTLAPPSQSSGSASTGTTTTFSSGSSTTTPTDPTTGSSTGTTAASSSGSSTGAATTSATSSGSSTTTANPTSGSSTGTTTTFGSDPSSGATTTSTTGSGSSTTTTATDLSSGSGTSTDPSAHPPTSSTPQPMRWFRHGHHVSAPTATAATTAAPDADSDATAAVATIAVTTPGAVRAAATSTALVDGHPTTLQFVNASSAQLSVRTFSRHHRGHGHHHDPANVPTRSYDELAAAER